MKYEYELSFELKNRDLVEITINSSHQTKLSMATAIEDMIKENVFLHVGTDINTDKHVTIRCEEIVAFAVRENATIEEKLKAYFS